MESFFTSFLTRRRIILHGVTRKPLTPAGSLYANDTVEPIVATDACLGHALCGAHVAPSLARLTSTFGIHER